MDEIEPRHDDLPGGTVTFLFTDIEGSTRLERELRERYSDVLAEHQRVVRGVFERHRGREIDTQGDSFFIAFPRAGDAVAGAVELQRELASHPWPDGQRVRLRIGMHTGEASLANGRYVGLAVHRAARLSAAGHGGQILVSASTRDVVEDDLPAGQQLRDLGEHRLKDLPRPEHVFQLVAEGLDASFPPLKALEHQELPEAAVTLPATSRPGARTLRRPLVIVVAGLLAVVALAGAAVALSVRDGEVAPTVVPNSLVKIDAGSNEIVDVVPIGRDPGQLEVVGDYLCVASERDNALYRVDLASGEVVTSGRHEASGSLAAEGVSLVWVASTTRAEASRVQAESLTALERIRLPRDLARAFLAVGGGSLWVSEFYPPAIVEYGLRSLAIRRTYPLNQSEDPVEVTFAEGAAWIGLGSGALLRIDARSHETSLIPVAEGASDPKFGFGSLWIAGIVPGVVTRIDPVTERARAVIEAGTVPFGLAVGAGYVWVTSYCDGTVSRIDPATNTVTDTIEIGYFPKWMAVARGHLWVGLAATDTVTLC